MSDAWQQTACILCSVNCGIEVQLDGRPHRAACAATRPIPARTATPARRRSASTTTRTAAHRLTSPLRRRADGTLRGDRLGHRDPRGRRAARARSATRTAATTIFYYGGGGQGNHLGGAYAARDARARSARSTRSNALAQEKTGEFWVDGQLFGRPRCHTTGDFEHAEVAVFVGKNPWQSHGFPRARADPARDRGRPGARADRHRPAPHRDRRARRLPPPGAARAPTPSASRALLAVLVRGGPRRPRRSSREHTRGRRGDLRRARARSRSPTTARAPASPRRCVRAVARRIAARRERLDLRGPRHPAGAAQHAELVPREAALPAHRQLREARRR